MRMEELLSAAADEIENKQRAPSQEKRKSSSEYSSGDTDDGERITTSTTSTSTTTSTSSSSPLDDSTITSSFHASANSNYTTETIFTANNKNKNTNNNKNNTKNDNDNNNNNSRITTTTTYTSTNKTKSPLVSPRNSIRTRSKRDNPPPLTIDPDSDYTPTTSSSTTSTTSSTPSSSPSPSSASVTPVQQCKTPGCVVCLKGPPSSFSKGTPIWAQILHLVLYALTESARVHVMGSPKTKVKRYFHLRDDIYEYISIHWDVICRRERIKNWRHTIGMTLSHYQNLFQNGYHIYQNTGYWSMKDNVPSPYAIDPLLGEGASPGKKRKYNNANNSKTATDKEFKETNMTPFISDFPISPLTEGANTTTTSSNNDNDESKYLDKDDDGIKSGSTLPPFNPPLASSSQSVVPTTAVRFDEMKNEIDRFKKEMGSLQSEIDALQEQLQVKKAEEHLLKFLQEGITSFRDKIKQRIDLLRTEMINNHSEHQQQIHTMASELTQLREIGADLRSAFQYQFKRLAHINSSQLQV